MFIVQSAAEVTSKESSTAMQITACKEHAIRLGQLKEILIGFEFGIGFGNGFGYEFRIGNGSGFEFGIGFGNGFGFEFGYAFGLRFAIGFRFGICN